VVSFTPLPLYPQGKSPWYPLDRRLGGPQSRSGRGGLEKNKLGDFLRGNILSEEKTIVNNFICNCRENGICQLQLIKTLLTNDIKMAKLYLSNKR
jgi:hypothetical protein